MNEGPNQHNAVPVTQRQCYQQLQAHLYNQAANLTLTQNHISIKLLLCNTSAICRSQIQHI